MLLLRMGRTYLGGRGALFRKGEGLFVRGAFLACEKTGGPIWERSLSHPETIECVDDYTRRAHLGTDPEPTRE